jgi:hypothetical protein
MRRVVGTVRHGDGSVAVDVTVEVHNSNGDVLDQIRTTDEGLFTYYLTSGHWTFETYDGGGHRGTKEVILDEDDATFRVDLEIK